MKEQREEGILSQWGMTETVASRDRSSMYGIKVMFFFEWVIDLVQGRLETEHVSGSPRGYLLPPRDRVIPSHTGFGMTGDEGVGESSIARIPVQNGLHLQWSLARP